MDTQAHSLQCAKVKTEIKVEGTYNDIFKEKIPSTISKTLFKITKVRKHNMKKMRENLMRKKLEKT